MFLKVGILLPLQHFFKQIIYGNFIEECHVGMLFQCVIPVEDSLEMTNANLSFGWIGWHLITNVWND